MLLVNKKQNTKYDDITLRDVPLKKRWPKKIMPYQPVEIDISFSEMTRHYRETGLKIDDSADCTQDLNTIKELFIRDPKRDSVLVNFCVRSALHMYLSCRNFQKDSEVIFTGFNIPDMVQIVQEHGLKTIPLDLNLETLEPTSVEDFKNLITPKTKVFVVAYIHGVRYDIAPYAEICKEKGIELIEDVAQSFSGTREWVGTPEAKLTMFSFGTIKTQTCFGGAVSIVHSDQQLAAQMEALQNSFKIQTKKEFQMKILKAFGAKVISGTSLGCKSWFVLGDAFTKDREQLTLQLIRGFVSKENFLGKFNIRPGPALLSVMAQRLPEFNENNFLKGQQVLREAMEKLVAGGVFIPGYKAKNRNFWMFCSIMDNKELYKNYMIKFGVYPFSKSSQIENVQSSDPDIRARNCEFYSKNILALPLHKGQSRSEMLKIVNRLVRGNMTLLDYAEENSVERYDDPIFKELNFGPKL